MKVWAPGNFVAAADLNGDFANPTPQTVKCGTLGWLEGTIRGTETAMMAGGILSLAPSGAAAAVFGSRSSDSTNGGAENFALGSFAINNNTSSVQTLGAAYMEVRRTQGSGVAQGLEIGSVNNGEAVDSNPWYMGATGSTLPLWLSAGRTDVSGNDITMALGIINNGNRFTKGIVFGQNAVTVGVVGAEALVLATQQCVSWHGTGDYGPNAVIRSDTNAASATGLRAVIFTDTGVVLRTPDGLNSIDCSSGKVTTTNIQNNGTLTQVGGTTFGGINVFGGETHFNGAFLVDHGSIELGSPIVNAASYLDFHSSGINIDFDVRLMATGGTGTVGAGTFDIFAGQTNVHGVLSITTASVTGNLSVNGTSNLLGSLAVAGAAGFNGAVNVLGLLQTSTSVLVGGGITVVGASVLESTMAVAGAAGFNSSVSVVGNLTVNGLSSINGGLSVGGNGYVAGAMAVAGALNINGRSAYANNTAARAAGLNPGDVYINASAGYPGALVVAY